MADDVRAAMIGRGQCDCGRHYMIVQSKELAEMLFPSVSDFFDVYVTGPDTATCSQCGRVGRLPPAEILDVDRSPLGRGLLDLYQNREASAGSTEEE